MVSDYLFLVIKVDGDKVYAEEAVFGIQEFLNPKLRAARVKNNGERTPRIFKAELVVWAHSVKEFPDLAVDEINKLKIRQREAAVAICNMLEAAKERARKEKS